MCLSDERKAYLLRAKLPAFKKRVSNAIEITKNALANSCNAALSFSSGKDSVVLLDVAIRAGFRGRLVFFKYGITTDTETPTENIELLKYYACKHGLDYDILDCLGESDCFELCGRFTLFPESEKEKKAFNDTNYDFIKKSRKFEEKYDIDLGIIGMRKDESRRRKIVLSKFGAIYQTKSKKSVTCCPLLNFSNEDVWAYIFAHDLKYLPVYDYPYIDRCVNRNEITMLYNDAIVRHGMMYHYKQIYSKYFEYLQKRWGNIGF